VRTERARTERDFAALYREAGPTLWRAIYAYSAGRRALCDDVVAEAFARGIEHSGQIREPVPWLYRTAFRLAASELRRERRRGPIVEESYEDEPEVGEVLRAMRQLSPRQRGAVFLHHQADLPVREVAKLMGTSTSAVKVHLHRGRARLRELLGDQEN
jgi:RNA polymerase sigma-70 factor, ECF subfamily